MVVRSNVMNKKNVFKEIIFIVVAIAFIFFFPRFGLIPLPYGFAVVITLAIWWYLQRTHENFNDLGFSFRRFEPKAVIIGAVAAVLIFSFLQYIFFPVLTKIIPLEKANLDDFKKVRHHTGNYIFFLVLSWLGGGFYEELVFHGFIFTRLEKMIPGKNALRISFLLTNTIFGLYHFQLGIGGVFNAFLAGSAYHALMIKYKRNLWYSIFVHGFFDTIAFTYIYLGYW